MKVNKRRIKTALWLLLLTAVTGVTLMAARFQADALVTGMEVELVEVEQGNHLILPEEFITMVTGKFGPVKDLPIDMIDMRSMEEWLQTHPYVRQADVYLGATGALVLRVHQRIPLLRIVDNSGKHWYIDTDTVRMPVSVRLSARVPLVNGDFPATQDLAAWKTDLLMQLGSGLVQDEFMRLLIDQVYVEKPDRIWLVPRLGPSRILLGNLDDLAGKMERIRKFYRKALPSAGWDTYAYIDARFADQIVAKKRMNH